MSLPLLVEDAGDIGQEDQLARTDRRRDGGGRHVGVDVEAVAIGAESHRGNDGQDVLVEQEPQKIRVHRFNLAHEAEVPFSRERFDLFGAEQARILAREADRHRAEHIEPADDFRVHAAGEYHLDDPNVLFTGDALTLEELAGLSHAIQGAGDFGSTAVHDDRSQVQPTATTPDPGRSSP